MTQLGDIQALNAMSPSMDFRTTVDTSRYTKAVYLAADTGTDFNIYNELEAGAVSFTTGGQVIPVRTKTAITATGFNVVYLY